ncbi:uncharacterized protein N7498_007436 [Penicillium cinerascens]|uniref:RRM domain-containing protein n=1 Tax=Penicillium cinerascens TaxID=70096 RepID=A0A9W9JL52_9EURO|nr:uncharacterized protein N7498_007436 [Penicillium cinerascens]KAJ5198319.1 hypothetical protein N7498_007436 [Penicillium cinerascens]
MTIQVVENSYPRRGDRMQEEPSAKNAQGLFSPDALSTKIPTEQLAEDLKEVFARFGPCHVKIKQDKKKNLPGAFVQFERVADANAALGCDQCTQLHERWLRIERAKGRRTALLGLRSGAAITQHDITSALGGRGPLEAWCIESHQSGFNCWTNVGKVTFAYVDDCRDAIKANALIPSCRPPLTTLQHFSKDHSYYLSLLDMDGSPLIPGSGSGNDQPRTKSYNGHQSSRGNHSQRGYHGQRGHRTGPPRGGNRGFSRFRQSQYHQENINPRGGYENSHHQGGYQNAPNMVHGMPYGGDHPPFYPPPASNNFAPPPFIINGQPVYSNHHPSGLPHHQPGTFVPGVSNGPFIVSGQPPYSPVIPALWGEPYQQNNGYYGPQFNMPNHPQAYFSQTSQTCYNEPYLQSVTHFTVPYSNKKATSPSMTVVTVKEVPKTSSSPEIVKENDKSDKKSEPDESSGPDVEANTEIDLFNLEDPKNGPRLIRVHDSDTEDTDYEEEPSEPEPRIELKSEPEKPTRLTPALAPVAEEVEEDSMTPEPISESDSNPVSDSDKSADLKVPNSTQSIRDEPHGLSDSICEPTPQPCSHRPLDVKYQPGTGKTIEEYVRLGAEGRHNEYTEETLLDIIRELEQEQKDRKAQKDEDTKVFESGSSSQGGSVARSLSSKSA